MRDLSLHILDVARNGIEAGASRVAIRVSESRDRDSLRIEITDNGRGMDGEALEQACDPFYTTRTTRRVGMGLSLFRATCERCDGAMEIGSSPGEGTQVTGTLRLSHLDRPPLGDMGGAVASLACGSSGVAISYAHRTDTGGFELSTEAVEAEFGAAALSDPATLMWLQEQIRSEVRAAGSTA